MAEIYNLKAFTPSIRCYVLIGRFLEGWAHLENEINAAIGAALGLDFGQRVIVTANMQVRDKIFLLRTAVNHALGLQDSEKEKWATLLKAIGNYAPKRNHIAHTLFAPEDNGTGVKFFVMKAKGKLQVPDEVWSIERFNTEFDQMYAFMKEVELLTTALEANHGREALIKVLAATTMTGRSEPGILNLPDLQLPSDPSSQPPAIPETMPQKL